MSKSSVQSSAAPRFTKAKPHRDFVLSGLAPAARSEQQADPHHDGDSAVDRPLDLAGHETAWQHVDPLQEPDAAEEHKKTAEEIQNNFHIFDCPEYGYDSATAPTALSKNRALSGHAFLPVVQGQTEARTQNFTVFGAKANLRRDPGVPFPVGLFHVDSIVAPDISSQQGPIPTSGRKSDAFNPPGPLKTDCDARSLAGRGRIIDVSSFGINTLCNLWIYFWRRLIEQHSAQQKCCAKDR
jgi:hypothetical protein